MRFWVLVSLLALVGCVNDDTPRRPAGVILISVDGLGFERSFAEGNSAGTPTLQRIRREGVSMEGAASVAPMTRPVVASLLTGHAPDRLAVRDDIRDRLGPAFETTAERLQRKGFETVAFVGHPSASFAAGFDRGFDLFDGPNQGVFGPPALVEPGRSAEEVAKNFTTWIQQRADANRPFFAWLHLSDLRSIATKGTLEEARAGYDLGLAAIDRAIGQILAALEAAGVEATTDLFVLGTFGVFLGEGGRRGAQYWLEPETLHVPILWRGPSVPGGPDGEALRSAPVWLPDIAATILEIAGDTPDATLDGKSLLGRVPGERVRIAWSWAPDDDFGWPTRVARNTEGRWEPLGESPSGNTRLAVPRPRLLSEASRDDLRRLGVRLGPIPSDPSPPPGDEAAFIQLIWDVRHALIRPYAPLVALRRSKRAVEAEPDNLGALVTRLFVVHATEGPETSRKLAERLLERFPDRQESFHWAAHDAIKKEELVRAEALLKAALEVATPDAEIVYDLACVKARLGDRDRAVEALGRSIELGFRAWEWIETDPDLASVRADPRYASILRAHGR